MECVLVTEDDYTGDAQAGGPAGKDDLVLIAYRPVLDFLSGGEACPLRLLGGCLTLDLLETRACPCRHVILDTAAFRLDGEKGCGDHDNTEGFE